MSQRAIDNYRVAGADPSRDRLVRLARAGGVPLEWLATGEGDAESSAAHAVQHLESDDRYIRVPRYDVQAAAGPGAVVDAEQLREYVRFDASYLRVQLGLNPSQLALIEAVGDSMTPTIKSGDLLLVDTRPAPRADGIYVLGVEDTVLVKRLSVRLGGRVVISSDNPKYPPEEIDRRDLDRLRIIGRVVWVGGPV